MPWLGALLTTLLGSAVARLLTGAGLGLLTFAAITPLVLSVLNAASQRFAGIGGSTLDVMLIGGLGEGLSAVGAAIMTRVAIEAGRVALTKAASS